MTSGETVLITGGTGFIGAYTAAALLEDGHEVVSFDLRTESPLLEQLDIQDEIQTIRGDVTDETAVFHAIRDTQATRLIHLAALLTTQTRAQPRQAIDVNITAMNTMLEATRLFDDQVERLVWASSSAVYAPPGSYDDRQVTENDLLRPGSLYGAAKAYNERQAEVYREDYDISHVGLRPTLVYGPYRESGSATAYANVMKKPALNEAVEVGPGRTVLDWQYVTDAAQAFQKATFAPDETFTHRAYNICGEQAPLEEVAAVVRDLLPNADITITEEGEIPWTHTMDDTAAKTDFDYDPQYDLRKGVRAYVNVLREEEGYEPV